MAVVVDPAGSGKDKAPAPGARREHLTRERVVATALKIMDAEGLEALTMRRLGRELGVEAMSLYNHVTDKEDLLDAVRELVLTDFEDPGTEGPWEERVKRAALSWRRVLRDHPITLALVLESKRPNMSPASIRPTEVALRLIGESGLDRDDAVRAFCAFSGYILGFAMFEIATARTAEAAATMPAPDQIAAALPPEEFPCFAASLPALMADDLDERFEYGLDLLIAGLQATTSPTTAREGSAARG